MRELLAVFAFLVSAGAAMANTPLALAPAQGASADAMLFRGDVAEFLSEARAINIDINAYLFPARKELAEAQAALAKLPASEAASRAAASQRVEALAASASKTLSEINARVHPHLELGLKLAAQGRKLGLQPFEDVPVIAY